MEEKIKLIIDVIIRSRNFVQENSIAVFGWGVLLLIALPLVCAKFQEVTFVSKDVGYEFRAPRGWAMTVAPDKKTVEFTKEKSLSNVASIKTEIDDGNPYGATLVDFIYAALIPQVRNEYELKQRKMVQFTQLPTGEYRDEVEWAKCSFFVDADSIYEIVLTVSNGYVITFRFESHGYGKERDQKEFHRMIDSVKLFKVSHVNYFEEEIKNKEPAVKPRRRGTM